MSIGKLLGAAVVAIVLVVAVNVFGGLVYNAGAPVQIASTGSKSPAKAPAASSADAGTAAAPAASAPAPAPQIAGLIGNPEAGKKVSRQCAACHTFDEGGPNRVGPNLWNVVGSDVAAHDGFNYSDAMKGVEGTWTLEQLHAWVADPKGFAPGNKMTFAGVKSEDDINNLIAYLQTLQPADEVGKLGPQSDAAEAPAAEEGAAEAPATEEGAAEAPADAAAAPAEGEAPAADASAADAGAAAGAAVAVAGDAAAGEKAMRACAACHTWTEGGPNRVGPNLYGVVGADIAAHDGFKYSKALEGLEGTWTVEALDGWLKDPRGFAKGNKMTYAGVKDDTERQNIIAFLATLR